MFSAMADMTLACFLGRMLMGAAGEGIAPWERIADGAGQEGWRRREQGSVKRAWKWGPEGHQSPAYASCKGENSSAPDPRDCARKPAYLARPQSGHSVLGQELHFTPSSVITSQAIRTWLRTRTGTQQSTGASVKSKGIS